jgi:glycosyltransferase involved in cell wall biosynthesis
MVWTRRPAEGEDILFLSQYHWETIWRRNQHVAKHLSRSRKIFYLTPFPCSDMNKLKEPGCLSGRWITERIFALSLPVFVGESTVSFIRTINRIWVTSYALSKCRKTGISPAILWYSHPHFESISRYWKSASVIYDVQDEYPAVPTVKDLFDREVELLRKANLVLTGTYSLYQKKRQYTRNIHFVACGVDYHHFHRACESETEVPPEIASIEAEKRLGYFGAIGDRIDWSLLREICVRHPDWAIILIGVVHRIGPEVKGLKNLHILGVRSYDELPYYIKGFHVCLIPFKVDDYTRYIYPTKLLEYLSAGKPVISSPIPDVERFFSGIVGIAGDIESFEEEMARIEEDGERIGRGIDMASKTSWEKAVGDMEELLQETLRASDSV